VELTLSTNVVIILISQLLPMSNKLSESLIPNEKQELLITEKQ